MEITRLTKLSEYERTREDNILQNNELLERLGIGNMDGLFGGAKRNNDTSSNRGKKSGTTKKAGVRDSDADDFEPDEPDNEGSEVVPHIIRPCRSGRLGAPSLAANSRVNSTERTVENSATSNPSQHKEGEREQGTDESVDEGDSGMVDLSLAPAVEVNRAGWPEWVETWYNIFVAKDFGSLWVETVRSWTSIEREYNWESAVSTPSSI
jgi:hypothetical protein